MTIAFYDRVKETTSTTGTGTLTLLGAVTNFQAFSVVGNGNQTYYAIEDTVNNAWEVGIGTYTVSGTTLSRTTILASSNSGSAVNLAAGTKDVFIPPVAAILNLILPKTGEGSIGSLPGSPNAGDLFLTTDSPYDLRYGGSGWDYFGPRWNLTPPVDANFAWVNQSTATVSVSNGMVTLTNTTSAGGSENLNIRKLAAPGSTPYSVTALVMPQFGFNGLTQCGICLRESGSGKLVTLTIRNDSVTGFSALCMKYNSPTAYSGSLYYFEQAMAWAGNYFWLRIHDDGTDRYFQMSRDGFNWQTITSIGRTDFITPDEIGFFINPYAEGMSCSFLHWLGG